MCCKTKVVNVQLIWILTKFNKFDFIRYMSKGLQWSTNWINTLFNPVPEITSIKQLKFTIMWEKICRLIFQVYSFILIPYLTK